MNAATAFKNKTLTTLLATLGGALGLHRFYLHGTAFWPAYAYPAVTAIGMLAALAWLPLLAIALLPMFTGFIEALMFGLTPDAKWDPQWNAASGRENDSGWAVVIIVILTLAGGITLLTSFLAISFQALYGAVPG
jgi:hypothetical protein